MKTNDNLIQQTRKLNPEKLFVEYRNGATPTEPVLHRRYTLTHSDITADLFFTVGLTYAWDKTNPTRDEVLAEWRTQDCRTYLYLYVHLDVSEADQTARRDLIFRRELPLALEAIVYGERNFFRTHPELLKAPIWICFDSTDPLYQRLEYGGVPVDYLVIA